MPETSQTLRDLISGFNSMQAQLGLTPMSGQSGFMALPTPPPIKHPGQASQEAAQIATRQSQETVQAVAQVRQLAAPGVLGLRPAAVPDASGAAGAYASQYRERMQSIESGYLSPYQAQTTANTLGQPGFSGLPSPVFRTAPSMGIFRPSMAVPPPMQLARDQPMIRTPFTPALPSPMFQQPWQQDYQQATLQDERMFSATMAAMPTAAYVGAGALTTGIGGRLGGRFGTAGRIGGLAVGAAAGFGLIGHGAEMGMEHGLIQPVMNVRAAGRQLEQMSQQFVVGGPDLNPITGQGLAPRAAMRVANQLQQDVSQGRTGGFNMRDMMRIGGMAADAGMMDMAQSEQQVGQQLRNVARGLQAFMRLANEPDVRRAMQQMATFRSMGLTVPETNMAMANSTTFARMAGVSTQTLAATAGAPGAMTFQQLGMTAGLGFQVGGAAAALGQQAIAGGAFNPAQLAMAGGRSGVTQTLTEAAGAGLGVDFPILAALSRGKGGQLTIDPGRVKQIMSGKMSLSEQAQMGAENVNQLGGDSVIMELHTRMNELRDQLGRQLGPQGSVMYAMRQATNLMKEVPGMSFGGALSHLGMSPQQARTVELMGSSPQFWENLKSQQEVTRRQLREEERSRRDRDQDASTLSGRLSAAWQSRGWTDRVGEMGRGAVGAISEWWTDRGAAARAGERGEQYVGRSHDIELNKRESDSVSRYIQSEGFGRSMGMAQRELFRGTGFKGVSTGEALGGLWNTTLGVGTGVASVYGGPLGGLAAGTVADQIRSNAPGESNYVAALKARGGVSGAFASAMPSLALAGGAQNIMEAYRAHTEAQGAARAGFQIQQAENLSGGQVAAINRDLGRAYGEYAKQYGTSATATKDLDLDGAMTKALTGLFEDNSHWYGDKAVTQAEMKEAVIKARVKAGEDRRVAEAYVNDKWDKGLGASVLNQTEPLLSKSARASWAKTKKATGYEGKLAGANLNEVQKNAENVIDDIKKATGFYAGLDASKKSWQIFREQVMTGTPEETMAMVALAGGLGTDKETEEARQIRQQLLKEVGPEKYDEMMQAARAKFKGISADDREMFEEYGAKLKGKTGKDIKTDVEKIQEKLKSTSAGVGMAKGAAAFQEAGITGMGKMFGEGGAEAAIQDILKDPAQMRELERMSPELAEAARAYKESGGDKTKQGEAVQRFAGGVFKAGGGGRKTGGTYGGEGVGGEGEKALNEQQGVQESIEAAIQAGQPNVAFAKAVPVLAGAASKLEKTSENLDKVTRAAALMFKMPWGL